MIDPSRSSSPVPPAGDLTVAPAPASIFLPPSAVPQTVGSVAWPFPRRMLLGSSELHVRTPG